MKGAKPTFTFSKIKSSDVKELLLKLKSYYGIETENLRKYFFYMNHRGKVYLSSVDLSTLEVERINSIGLYFGTYHDEERFRLSIEGSQFIEPKRNFVLLNEEALKSYLAAENLFLEEVEELDWKDYCPFVIVRFNGESLGCMSVKGNELLNYVSKSRKLDFNKVF